MIPNILLENCLWKGKHAESGRNLLIWRSARADQQSTINNWEISTDLPFPDFLAHKSRLKGGSKLDRECLIQNWNIRFLPKSECLHCTVLSNMEFIMIEGTVWQHMKAWKSKHCQRQSGPEGWVQITSSYTNLDQISISESRLGINFKISIKHEHPD